MYTKYYTISIMDTNKVREERKHKKILRKRIKRACGIAGVLGFFYLLGVVGGLEQGTLTIQESIVHGIIAISIFGISIKISDEI